MLRCCRALQDEAAATHAAKLEKAEGQLDFRQEACVLHNKVGCLHAWDFKLRACQAFMACALLAAWAQVQAGACAPAAQVRAFAGWPGTQAVFRLGGEGEPAGKLLEVRITRTRVLHERPASPAWPPMGGPVHGWLEASVAEGLVIECGRGTSLEVQELQPAGRNVMSAAAFLHGLKNRRLWVQQQTTSAC